MAFVRTNLGATIVQRHLLEINRNFNTSLERLSTGLRINRPEDSPGEFGMVSLQNNMVRSIERGVVNAQNAEGLLQTAEEGLAKIDEILNRMHELAVEAADSTLSMEQRQAAQDEIDALLNELNDIPNSVKYAGIPLLAVAKRYASISGAALGEDPISIGNSSGAQIISNEFNTPTDKNPINLNTVLRIGVSTDGTVPNVGRVVLNFSASSPQELAQKVEDAIESQLGSEYVEGGDLHIDVYATSYDVSGTSKTRLIFRTSTVAGDKSVASVDDDGKISGTPIIRASEVSTREGDETFQPTFFSGTSQASGTLLDDRLKILVDGETVFVDMARGDYLISITGDAATTATTLQISADDAAKLKKADIIEIRQGLTTGTAQILHIEKAAGTATLYLDKTLSNAGFTNSVTGGASYVRVTSSNYKLGNLLNTDNSGGNDVTITIDATGGAVSTNTVTVTAKDIGMYLNPGDQVVLEGTETTTSTSVSYTLTIASIGSYDDKTTTDNPSDDTVTITFDGTIDVPNGQKVEITSMKIINGGQLARDIETSINSATNYAEDVSVGIDDSRDVVITSGISGIQSYVKILGGSVDSTENVPLFQELGFNYLQYDQGQGSDFAFQLGGAEDVFRISIDLVSPTSLGADGVDISDIDVSSQAGANAAVEKLELAIQSIGTTATKVGAAISAIRRRQDVLEVHRENLIEQRARLEEVDFAQETQRFTQLQILLQSATAVLAQANIVPTTLLQLLG